MPPNDLYRVILGFTDSKGYDERGAGRVVRVLKPVGSPENDVETTARQVWAEAGSPKNCHIWVKLAPVNLGEWYILDGIWKPKRWG